MEVNNFRIEGLLELKPRIFKDDRGQFIETYNQETLEALGFTHKFVQDNQSISQKGVFRGIHLQREPHAQGKLVRVVKGSVVDYAVDLRPNSPTFGHWTSILLKGEWGNQFYVPAGFGHAFVALEEDTIFAYKCTNNYNKESEVCLKWDDKDINLDVAKRVDVPLLVSEKDEEGISLQEYVKLYCSSL